MSPSPQKSIKLLALVLMLSMLLTGCSLLPTTLSDALDSGAVTTDDTGNDTVTISREEYDRLKQFEELSELKQIVEANFYKEPDETGMLDGAMMGLLYGLNDPYTFYYTPENYAAMWADDTGEYAGVGIQIMRDYTTGICTISRVFLNSPALEVGIRKGDILTKVDDLDVTATNLDEAVAIMRGATGETVNVSVLRGDEKLDFVIARAVIHVNWVNSCMLDASVGYISLYEFSGDCSSAFQTQLDALIEQGAKSLVIDLRDNPGGWVDDAAKVADIFLPEGVVTTLKYRDGTTEAYNTKDGQIDIPLVLLVNENSASASEILAGALQDLNRAVIVGTQTFGKGVVQYVLPVGTRGAGMQITAAQYFTPNGNPVHEIGITPDVIAEWPEGDTTLYELGDLGDAQLKKAYEVALETIDAAGEK